MEIQITQENLKIGIIGLGYVGLPLAVLFAQRYPVVALDIDDARVGELQSGIDRIKEVSEASLKEVLVQEKSSMEHMRKGLFCTSNSDDLASCTVYIVTVPTPTDDYNKPILTPLVNASYTIGKNLRKGDVVIYESTVYPGVTEEVCVPILTESSKLKYNSDFFVGYSPERINPGDKVNTVENVLKVTSGSTPETALFVDELYKSVIHAGTFRASSLKVAEAAKVIENSQRDINIAFVNELAKIFDLLEIDTQEVLEAAGTKWNFLPFKPGLVGGHCIGVDPYYLAQKAQEVGYHPEIILAGRRLNDSMGTYVAGRLIKLMVQKKLPINESKVLILGFTFKENCPDIRNTRVVDVYRELISYHIQVSVYDPWAIAQEVEQEYGIQLLPNLTGEYSAVLLAVAHNEFKDVDIRSLAPEPGVIYDVKGMLDKDAVDGRL
jgi:UDP-N-acetyl-D-galactosamine dehydrogenase